MRVLNDWLGKAGAPAAQAVSRTEPRVGLDGCDLVVAGERRRVEPCAAAVLRRLAERPRAVVSRAELLERCWGEEAASDAALTQAVAQLRRALKHDPKAAKLIETVPKGGYRWLGGPLAEAPRPDTAPAVEPSRSSGSVRVVVALVLAVLVAAGTAAAVLISGRAPPPAPVRIDYQAPRLPGTPADLPSSPRVPMPQDARL